MNALGTDFDTALTRGALAALALAALWSVVVVLAVALEARTGGRVRVAERTGCPRALRMWLLAVFVALFAGVAPAQASDAGAPDGTYNGSHDRSRSEPDVPHRLASGSGDAVDSALDGLPLPDRAVGGSGHRATASAARVVVRPGDSLWRIARSRLPESAAPSTVARTVEELYAANRREIGPEPDRIRPGQHLDFPYPTTLTEEP